MDIMKGVVCLYISVAITGPIALILKVLTGDFKPAHVTLLLVPLVCYYALKIAPGGLEITKEIFDELKEKYLK